MENKEKKGFNWVIKKIWMAVVIVTISITALVIFMPNLFTGKDYVVTSSIKDMWLRGEAMTFEASDGSTLRLPIGIYSGNSGSNKRTFEFYDGSIGESPNGKSLWGELTMESLTGEYETTRVQFEATLARSNKTDQLGLQLETIEDIPITIDFIYDFRDESLFSEKLNVRVPFIGWSESQKNELINDRPIVQNTEQVYPTASIQEGGSFSEPISTTEPATRESADSSFIFESSSTTLLTNGELDGLTKEQLRLARNEIYARHGYIFSSQDLNEYFSGKTWYQPSSQFDDSQLTEVEKANINFIKSYEEYVTTNSIPMKLIDGMYSANEGIEAYELTISNNGSSFFLLIWWPNGEHGANEYGDGLVTSLGNNQYALDYYETDGFERQYNDIITMTSDGFYSETLGLNFQFSN